MNSSGIPLKITGYKLKNRLGRSEERGCGRTHLATYDFFKKRGKVVLTADRVWKVESRIINSISGRTTTDASGVGLSLRTEG